MHEIWLSTGPNTDRYIRCFELTVPDYFWSIEVEYLCLSFMDGSPHNAKLPNSVETEAKGEQDVEGLFSSSIWCGLWGRICQLVPAWAPVKASISLQPILSNVIDLSTVRHGGEETLFRAFGTASWHAVHDESRISSTVAPKERDHRSHIMLLLLYEPA